MSWCRRDFKDYLTLVSDEKKGYETFSQEKRRRSWCKCLGDKIVFMMEVGRVEKAKFSVQRNKEYSN